MSSYKDIHFRFVPEGTGGTFTFSSNQAESSSAPNKGLSHMEYIGTYGCYTCVGIYLKIDQSRAYCMHVNGCSRIDFPKNIVADSDGEAMKEEFLRRLRKDADKENWDTSNQDFGKDLVVLCPNPDFDCVDGETYKRTGWYIVQGLREFLKIEADKLAARAREEALKPKPTAESGDAKAHETVKPLCNRAEFLYQISSELTADKDHQGFVAHHPTGEVKLFKVVDKPLSDNEIPEDLDGFVPRQEQGFKTMRDGKWTISTELTSNANKDLAQAIVKKNNGLLSHG